MEEENSLITVAQTFITNLTFPVFLILVLISVEKLVYQYTNLSNPEICTSLWSNLIFCFLQLLLLILIMTGVNHLFLPGPNMSFLQPIIFSQPPSP